MELRKLIEGSACILPGHKEEFIACLEKFPKVDDWLYGVPADAGFLYQGDLLFDVPVCLIDSEGDVIKGKDRVAMISNTCDMQPGRKENVVASVVFTLADHADLLKAQGITDEGMEERLRNIRENRVFSYFYLPPNGEIPEGFIDLSTMVTINSDYMNSAYTEKRVLSLSRNGFYLFLIKLTFHLARIEQPLQNPI